MRLYAVKLKRPIDEKEPYHIFTHKPAKYQVYDIKELKGVEKINATRNLKIIEDCNRILKRIAKEVLKNGWVWSGTKRNRTSNQH